MSEDDSELRERIRVHAYYLWVSEGCLSGLEEDYWRRAESHERGRPDRRLEALPPPGTSKVGFPESEVGHLTHDRAKVPAPSASAGISSGTATASEPVGVMAEPENLTSPSAPPPPSQSESSVEAESAASNAPAELASPETNSPSPPPKKTSARTGLRPDISSNTLFLHDFRSGAAPFRPGKGMTAAIRTDEDGVEYLALADGAVDAQSGGATEGYSLKVPDEVESAASGNRITVRAIARATGGGKSRVALAYSTNEVGNSGWRWFTVGAEWSAIAFEYDVHSMINGNGDFIGVLAEPSGKPGVDVCCVSVGIAPKAATG